MKTLIKRLFLGGVIISLLAYAMPVFAGTPYLSVTNEGSGDNVRITITNANPYSQITLYRRQGTSLWTTITNFGQTDSSGYYSTTVSLGSDGSSNPVEQYVVVGGLQSSTVSTYPYGGGGCYGYNCGNYGNITFSPQNPSLNVGQSLNVYVSAPYLYSGSYYISSNSNSNIVSASISGSTISLYGKGSGNSTITVCQSGYSSSCASLYVTVGGGGGYYGNLTLSQSNLSLSSGQSAAVTIYGGYGNFYISNNTNSNVASGSISGDKVNVYAYTSGSTTMTICSSNYSSCASLYVTVGGGTYGGNITIANTSLPTLVVGQYYSYQLTASGGVPPYKYEIISGALPAGLSLSENGLFSGVPQYAIAVNFGVRVRDNQYSSGTAYFSVSPSGTGSGSSSGGVLGTAIYKNGQLFKENGTVYIVYKNTKTGFATASAFTGLGFSFNNVASTGFTGLSDSGFVVNTSRAAHPWGSWVKSGQTVYFVHELGLIPVPSMDVFTSNGGEERLIAPANSYDFSLPVLSPMILNDSRLR